MTREMTARARRLRRAGRPLREIGSTLGVSAATIHRALRQRSRADPLWTTAVQVRPSHTRKCAE